MSIPRNDDEGLVVRLNAAILNVLSDHPIWMRDEPYGLIAEATHDAARAVLPVVAEELAAVHAAVIDLCWKATPMGETADGDVSAYILPKGVVHRLVGVAQSVGIPASLRFAPHAQKEA